MAQSFDSSTTVELGTELDSNEQNSADDTSHEPASPSDESKSKKRRIQKYRKAWERLPEFKSWLKPVSADQYKAHCIACDRNMVAEVMVLRKHALAKRHTQNVCGIRYKVVRELMKRSGVTSSDSNDDYECDMSDVGDEKHDGVDNGGGGSVGNDVSDGGDAVAAGGGMVCDDEVKDDGNHVTDDNIEVDNDNNSGIKIDADDNLGREEDKYDVKDNSNSDVKDDNSDVKVNYYDDNNGINYNNNNNNSNSVVREDAAIFEHHNDDDDDGDDDDDDDGDDHKNIEIKQERDSDEYDYNTGVMMNGDTVFGGDIGTTIDEDEEANDNECADVKYDSDVTDDTNDNDTDDEEDGDDDDESDDYSSCSTISIGSGEEGAMYNPKYLRAPLQIGMVAPKWKGQALVNGHVTDLKLIDYRGRYLVMFFYVQNFSELCSVELISMSDKVDLFRALNADVVACAIDSICAHLAWTQLSRELGGIPDLQIPLISDPACKISKKYGSYTRCDGNTHRATYIIDTMGILRHMSMNDVKIGRNIDELLRLISALQYCDATGSCCSAE